MSGTTSEVEQACPFCGAADAHHQSDYGDESQFVCAVCDARGPMKRSYIDSLTAWNTRPTPASHESEVERGSWTYSINYGPDGEANYANVYDGPGHLVGNLRTHHAIAVCAALRPYSEGETMEVLRTLGKSHSYVGAISPVQVTLGFHTVADRDAFIEAHIAAIQRRAALLKDTDHD